MKHASTLRRHTETLYGPPGAETANKQGLDLLAKYQGEAAAALGTEPGPRDPNLAKNDAYTKAVAMIGQYKSRMTNEELQRVLTDPVAGVKFMLDEVRRRPQGTKIAPLDPAVAGYLDATMLGPNNTVRQRTNADGSVTSEIVRKDAASGPWRRNANGELVMHNVKPREAAAAHWQARKSAGLPTNWRALQDARKWIKDTIDGYGERMGQDEIESVNELASKDETLDQAVAFMKEVTSRPPYMHTRFTNPASR